MSRIRVVVFGLILSVPLNGFSPFSISVADMGDWNLTKYTQITDAAKSLDQPFEFTMSTNSSVQIAQVKSSEYKYLAAMYLVNELGQKYSLPTSAYSLSPYQKNQSDPWNSGNETFSASPETKQVADSIELTYKFFLPAFVADGSYSILLSITPFFNGSFYTSSKTKGIIFWIGPEVSPWTLDGYDATVVKESKFLRFSTSSNSIKMKDLSFEAKKSNDLAAEQLKKILSESAIYTENLDAINELAVNINKFYLQNQSLLKVAKMKKIKLSSQIVALSKKSDYGLLKSKEYLTINTKTFEYNSPNFDSALNFDLSNSKEAPKIISVELPNFALFRQAQSTAYFRIKTKSSSPIMHAFLDAATTGKQQIGRNFKAFIAPIGFVNSKSALSESKVGLIENQVYKDGFFDSTLLIPFNPWGNLGSDRIDSIADICGVIVDYTKTASDLIGNGCGFDYPSQLLRGLAVSDYLKPADFKVNGYDELFEINEAFSGTSDELQTSIGKLFFGGDEKKLVDLIAQTETDLKKAAKIQATLKKLVGK